MYSIAQWMVWADPKGTGSRGARAVHARHADRIMARDFGGTIYG